MEMVTSIAMITETAAGAAMTIGNMNIVTSMATTMETAADVVTIMENMNIATNIAMITETAAGAAMTMENMNIVTSMATTMETAVDAVTSMGIAMTPMPTATMYRATLRTVTASCAILMRNTATYAARALTNVPVRCLTSIW